jgi:hypothetical protein
VRWLIPGCSLLLACGAEVSTPRGTGGAPSEAVTPSVQVCQPYAGAPSEETSPDGWQPPFTLHALGKVDASTLMLEAEGTWFWLIDGCDFWDCAGGNWIVEGDELLLTALTGRRLLWQGIPTSEVRLRRDGADGVSLRANGSDMEEAWAYGSVCADCCGGGLGPRGTYACQLPHADAETWASCTEARR